MVDQCAGDFDEIAICRGCRESGVGPQLAAHQGEGVGKGGERFGLPGGLTKRERGPRVALVMGEERYPGEAAEQRWRGPGDCAVRPRALGLDAKVGADRAEGDLQLPAQDEPGDDRERIRGEVGAQQGLCGERATRVADEHPANGDGWQAGVVPDGGVREELDGPFMFAVPASNQVRDPRCRRVIRRGRQRG